MPLTGPVASALNPTQVATTVTNGLTLQGTGVGFALPSLYKPTTDPDASYFIETDPLFTHRNTWLGSEYMTRRVSLDPSATQKRLGDGFFEQQMIREQVASLTGKRFLDNFTSEQQEYQALMDAGITFAQQFHLRPGIALTDVQVAQLSSDIVWLESQTVTLPNGQVTQALVPHVYLKPGKGDLTGQGALLSGSNVTLKATGDITNSGEIAGRQLLVLNANNVQNLAGQMAAQKVSITSQQDIVNQGGSVTALDSLNLQAGRDVVVETATTSSVSGAHSATILDRVAGLYVTASQGTLMANAGRDVTITAAELQSAGSMALQAGRNVNLNAQTTGSSDRFSATGEAKFHQFMSNTNQTGSKLEAAGNLSITAGNNLQGVAATVHGGGDVQLKAGNDVQLLAGQSTRSNDLAWTETRSNVISSKETNTQITDSAAKAIVSQVSGKTVDITAERNLVSQGTQLSGKDSLHVEGKDSQAYYAVQDVEQRSFHQETHQSLVGISVDKSSVSDSSFRSSSIASTLQSNEKIDINVGNVAYFEGTKVDAKQINLTQSDQSKAGQVILSASVDTTQKVHSETHETAGVWQAQSGNGETKQTANQTQFNGQLNINPNLQLTVQLGIKPGQTVNEQAHALSQLPGLSYLKDLENNPKVNWTGIELANKEWSYSQEGLTPAGAAMLAIAVAMATADTTGSAAASLTGSTSGAGYSATQAAISAATTQAAVMLANNGGDIGKTLQDMGRAENIKGLVTTAITAGTLQTLNPDWMKQLSATGQFTDKAVINLTNAAVSATIKTVIQGGGYEDNLLTSLKVAGVDTVAGWAASNIGEGYKSGDGPLSQLQDQYLAHKVAHALVGCMSAVAKDRSCAAGAVGGAVGEAFAEMYGGTADGSTLSAAKQQEVLNMSKLVTAAVAGLTGKDAQAAVDAAALAVINNFNSRTFPKKAREIQVVKRYPEDDPLKVTSGQFTFDMEGTDKVGLLNDSRVLHHPSGNSGVTIGRGIDLKEFTLEMADALFSSAGFSNEEVELFKKAVGLKGTAAEEFVEQNKTVIGRISAEKQNALFQISYELKKDYASEVYGRALGSFVGNKELESNWDSLDLKIKEIYVDLIYQGLPANIARSYFIPAMQANNLAAFVNGLIEYSNTQGAQKFRNRNLMRIEYLK
jgi:filamentous hemagglutinin